MHNVSRNEDYRIRKKNTGPAVDAGQHVELFQLVQDNKFNTKAGSWL